jgi:RNA polymerase sigma-70 factor (ECF subfamily)
MPSPEQSGKDFLTPKAPTFATTHWSVVLAAGDDGSPTASEALERLCRTYWGPLYAYVRRQGHEVHEAQDLTQEFFARLLEKHYLGLADPARGRFRTFLLTSLQNFLRNEWKSASRQKRGGGQAILPLDLESAEGGYATDPADGLTPEIIFEKRWAAALLDQVLRRLGEDYAAVGKGPLFEQLKIFVWGEKNQASYAQMAVELGLSEGAVKVAVHRLRTRYRELLRAEVASTVADPAEIDEELRHLIAMVGG